VEVKILLDTNRLSDALRGELGLIDLLERCEAVVIPFVALGEVKAGFAAGSRIASNELALYEFLKQPQVTVLFADRETLEVYAALFAYLRRQGRPIPTNDLWIAALAVQHGLSLVSRDRHFDVLPQVSRWV
jgi:tRNA(fMet)-specific endonuclease VapC